jgi:hypothetical protein
MPQHRLEHYFTPTRPRLIPSGRSFLDLPGHVRKLIYEYADLHDSFIDLNYSNLKAYAPGTYPDTRDCLKLSAQEDWAELRKLDVIDPEDIWEFCDDFDPGVYENSVFNRSYGLKQSLLLASREVHKEVEALIYSGLTFRVCLGQPLGFKRLWRMSDAALLNMQSLTIRLDVPKTKVESHGWSDYIRPPAYIDVSLKWGKSILKEWTSILKRLGQFVRPGQLKLRVIFCAKTMEDATAIIKPMSQLPLLKDCGICADLYGQDSWWEPVSFKRFWYIM